MENVSMATLRVNASKDHRFAHRTRGNRIMSRRQKPQSNLFKINDEQRCGTKCETRSHKQGIYDRYPAGELWFLNAPLVCCDNVEFARAGMN